MLLNTARCVACPNEVVGEHLNDLVWTTKGLGWVVVVARGWEFGSPTFICPRHDDNPEITGGKLPGDGIKWLAFCYTCDWEEEFWTEDDAKDEKRLHDCDDWDDRSPDIEILSPGQRRRKAEEEEQHQREAARRRREEAFMAKAEERYIAWLETENQRLQAILDKRTPFWKRVFGYFTHSHRKKDSRHGSNP